MECLKFVGATSPAHWYGDSVCQPVEDIRALLSSDASDCLLRLVKSQALSPDEMQLLARSVAPIVRRKRTSAGVS